jgi:hypothetical protein
MTPANDNDPWAFLDAPLTPEEEAAHRAARRWRRCKSTWLRLKDYYEYWRAYYPNDCRTGARIGVFRRLLCILFHGADHYGRGNT